MPVAIAATVVALTGCQPGALDPTLREVSFGFESLADPAQDWDETDARLERAGATAVALGAGRPEWTAFTWPEHPDAASNAVREADGAVLVRRAVDPVGEGRVATLVVDALMPRLL